MFVLQLEERYKNTHILYVYMYNIHNIYIYISQCFFLICDFHALCLQ